LPFGTNIGGQADELRKITLRYMMLETRNLKLENILAFLVIIEFPVSNFQFLPEKPDINFNIIACVNG